MQRTDLLDTDIAVHKARIRLLRAKTPEWRIQKAFELTDWSRSMFPEQNQAPVAKRVQRQVISPSTVVGGDKRHREYDSLRLGGIKMF